MHAHDSWQPVGSERGRIALAAFIAAIDSTLTARANSSGGAAPNHPA
jgi:hypothetical protein